MKKLTKLILCMLVLITLIPNVQVRAAGGPAVSAQAAILMDQNSGRVLYEKNKHKKMRIASITKVMTALLAIESGKLNETVTVSSHAYGTEGSSLYLKKGEKIKLKELVYGLLLRSGNDAAVAIAEHVAKSVPGFVYLMNEKARELGMKDTSFANPHGLDDPSHYSSAYDMALLTKYAMQNSTFRKMFGTKYHRSPQKGEKWDRVWRNKNKLLFQYAYSTGGKTGFTSLARRTLISTATKDHKDLIVVTLNDGDDWKDHQSLFDYGFKTFQRVQVVKKGKMTFLNQAFYKNHMYAKRSLYLMLTKEEKENLKSNVFLIQPPKKEEEWKTIPSPIGKVVFTSNDKHVGSLPLFYEKPKKEKKGFWSLFIHVISLTMGLSQNG
ncbi:D-alanyl-D-alanine carboxypeptidase [Terrilactibacillus sp. BCM23-1]|uniref:serine-type D-Ala-D-Ala carboxypeptidase n=1 Tax=Terrilactibacillus tamarindi TaxID=2599694 RepID=A0A6N8CPZ9_9BACI|nr:D-alanyl-D-alanine carboxypeptidase family protein [Terrilactibacillus tamarindi]MTT31237.1 D-alanyl-D-alanine carboxypeptidase [Terrilactibacillus tamarindi]